MPEKRKDLIWIRRIAFAFAMVLVVYYIIMTAIIPVSRFKIETREEKQSKNKLFLPDLTWRETVNDSIKNKTIELSSAESFLLSKLEMTDSDSISLAISLEDSSATLVVQGVTIFNAKIQAYQVSHAFKKIDPFVLSYWLSAPFVVDTHYSSVPKVPVLYKKAPKDTIEASSQIEPDPLRDDLEPVHFMLRLKPGLTIKFEQAEDPEKGYRRTLKVYKRKLRVRARRNIFNHLIRFTPIEFVPEIKIVLDKKSARVIYRALPVDALVALQLE